LTKRFDRVKDKKIHMQSFCAMAHFDFNMPIITSDKQAFDVLEELQLGKKAKKQF
jgi:serine/threonine-protein kinase HipA